MSTFPVSIAHDQAASRLSCSALSRTDPEHLVPVVGMFSDLCEEAGVVVGVAGTPLLGLAGLVEAFLAVLADRLQQPVAALRSVLLGHHQRTGHQARQRLEHRVGIDSLPTADRLDGLAGCSHRRTRPSRPSSRCSGSVSSSKDQSIAARSVW